MLISLPPPQADEPKPTLFLTHNVNDAEFIHMISKNEDATYDYLYQDTYSGRQMDRCERMSAMELLFFTERLKFITPVSLELTQYDTIILNFMYHEESRKRRMDTFEEEPISKKICMEMSS